MSLPVIHHTGYSLKKVRSVFLPMVRDYGFITHRRYHYLMANVPYGETLTVEVQLNYGRGHFCQSRPQFRFRRAAKRHVKFKVLLCWIQRVMYSGDVRWGVEAHTEASFDHIQPLYAKVLSCN